MARILFVGLPEGGERPVLVRLCAALDLAVERGRRVAILAPDPAFARRLDDLLWTADESSFLPHGVAEDQGSPLDRVVITAGAADAVRADVYVNFAPPPVPSAQWEGRSAEVVIFEMVWQGRPEAREAGRQKWTWYREQGGEPQKYELPAAPTTGRGGDR